MDPSLRRTSPDSDGGTGSPQLQHNNCPQVNPPEDEGAPGSPGQLSLIGADARGFNPREVRLTFALEGASYSADPADYALTLNGVDVGTVGLHVEPHAVSMDVVLDEGRNTVAFFGADSARYMVAGTYTLWVGLESQVVRVTDEAGAPVDGALVRLAVGDDVTVGAEAVTSGGSATFLNVPPRTLIATASAPGNLFGSAAALGDGQEVSVELLGFDAPSPIVNNDFQLGTDGWDVGAAPVVIIPHVESDSSGLRANEPETSGFMLDENLDLQLGTSGEGVQRVSRTFTVEAGTQGVTVRYRFITSEVPGGYFGSEYNDYFGVTIRSQAGGGRESEQNSMNALGLGAFDANGATGWREVTLPVAEEGDVVQVDAVVANVADGVYDSQLVIDAVTEGRLAITQVELKDRTVYQGRTDVEFLRFFSMGIHPYRGGDTWVWGTIAFAGAADDRLADVWVEASINGTVLTTGRLSPEAQVELFQPFGSEEEVRANLAGAAPLFIFPGSLFPAADEYVQLRVRAETAAGQTATFDAGRFPIFGPYIAENRFGMAGRDLEQGGDSWALPSTTVYASRLVQDAASDDFVYNDFSNMNGGIFRPHSTHQDGLHIDTRFEGYQARDAAAAQRLIAFLNGPYGGRVRRIGVTFTGSFRGALAGVTLGDGRAATSVIKDWAHHTEHFHLWLTEPGEGSGRFAGAVGGTNGKAWIARGPRQAAVGNGGDTRSDRPRRLKVVVAPNPVWTSGTLAVHITSPTDGSFQAAVYDVVVRLVHRFAQTDVAGGAAMLRWNPGATAAGVYLLRVTGSDGQSEVQRFVLAE